MRIEECNPFLRAAELQPAVLEGSGRRKAYDYRLFYVLKNEGLLILEGQEIPLTEETVLLIPPEVGYHFRGKLTVLVLNFDLTRACADRSKPICPPPEAEFRRELLFDPARAEGLERPFLLAGDRFLREQVMELVQEFKRGGEWQDSRTSAELKLLLAELLQRRRGQDSEDRLAAELRGLIRLRAAELQSNEQLAAELGYHPVYLGEVYRKAYGQSLHQAILEERIRLACRWLRQTDRSVEAIALDTGFSSRSHFCTVFSRMMGVSPGQWRRKQ